jgi:broad specificity phosphatase PhoE
MSTEERANYGVSTHEYGLTERGKKQAAITGEYLREHFSFDTYYASYYRRSKETMEIMYPGLLLEERKAYEDPRLAEAQRGIYHTMSIERIREKYPDELARKEREGLYHYRPLGGENWPDIELRVHSFLGTLNRDCEGDDVVIVVHGHWLLLFQKLVHHFSIDETLGRYKNNIFKNASITHYVSNKRELRLSKENFAPWEGKL